MQKLFIVHKKNIKSYLVKTQNIGNYFNSSNRFNKKGTKKYYINNIKSRKNDMLKCSSLSCWDINLKNEYIIMTILRSTVNINDYDYYDGYENDEDNDYNEDDNDNVDNRDYYIRKRRNQSQNNKSNEVESESEKI